MNKHNIFWFRRDLRLEDNSGLYHALEAPEPVIPLFIFDTDILESLEDRADPRVTFIYDEVTRLKRELDRKGSSLVVRFGRPVDVFTDLMREFSVHTVYANHDYEPYARRRDEAVGRLLADNRIGFLTFKDQVIFEKGEVLKDDGKPYTVFTPYARKWKALQEKTGIREFHSEDLTGKFRKTRTLPLPSLKSMGFIRSDLPVPPRFIDTIMMQSYAQQRDFPYLPGTSRLGVHLRFGTISIRQVVKNALRFSDVFLNELIWREFYMMILWNFPEVVHQSFKKEYDRIDWRNNEQEFQAWCEGRTGYPIVDAGMRQLNQTGYMHNRVRMITASFLAKHLLIDWRWGEAYFAKKLLDYELASNNGGWQWAAGTGCDAAPYFRVFNPTLQGQKFDPERTFTRQYVPEFGQPSYPQPIVEHSFARRRAIEIYKSGLSASR